MGVENDEFGIGWDDQDVRIGRPGRDAVLSERDRSTPAWAQVREGAPRF